MNTSAGKGEEQPSAPRHTTDWSVPLDLDEEQTEPGETLGLKRPSTPCRGSYPSDLSGVSNKCPACGASVNVGTSLCPDCGRVLRDEAGTHKEESPANLCTNPVCRVANEPGVANCVRCSALTSGVLLYSRYRVERFIATGGFGRVYRGVDVVDSNRSVAIKEMINNDPKEFAVRLKFFYRERDILTALGNVPIVPRIYDFIHEGQAAHLVMEFIDGENLLDVMAREGNRPFPVSLVIEWGKVICDVLEAMHSQSPPMIHRDVKPDNILLLADRRSIKMIDFGAARDLGQTAEEQSARKTKLGTPGYAPPEQVIAGKPEARSDLFALAATLYCLATGKEPEGHLTAREIEVQLANPSSPIPEGDRWFYELIRANLSEDINDRHPSAQRVRRDLEAQMVSWTPARGGIPTPPPSPWSPWPSPPIQPGDPLGPLRVACGVFPPDWWEILRLADEARQAGNVLPSGLQEMECTAKAKNDCFWRLQRAFDAGKLQDIVEAYDAELLDDWAACAEQVIKARHAVLCWNKLAELEGLAKNSLEGRTLLERWVQYAPDVMPWRESESIRQVVLSWEARNRAFEKLRDLVNENRPRERSIIEAWEQLQKVGGHPGAGSFRARVEQAALRAASLESLPPKRSPESESEDALVQRAWDELLLQDCPEAEVHRTRYDQARDRLQIVAALDMIIGGNDQAFVAEGMTIGQAEQSLSCERSIVDWAFKLPSNYEHRFVQRVKLAQERVRVAEALAQALHATPPSDRTIRGFWGQAQTVRLSLDVNTVRRCRLAEKRCIRLDQIEKIKPALPADRQDELWLKLWDPQLFQGCGDADKWRLRHKKACERVKAWKALDAALKANDLEKIASLANDPLLTGYPPLERIQLDVQDKLKQWQYLQKSKQILEKGDVPGFIAHFDLEYLRNHVDQFEPHRKSIEEILKRWMKENPVIAKADPPSVQEAGTGAFLVRWTWRFFGRISHCRVLVSPNQFVNESPEALEQSMLWDAEAHRRAGGGIPVIPIPGKRRLYVTVWPVIDLGWTPSLVGPPLHLGPIRVQGNGRQ